MRYRQESINTKEKGFILTKVIISLAIMGVLGIGLAVTIAQVFNESAHASTNTEAVQQVENAGYWISYDCLMAQTVTPGEDAGFPLVLTWITWSDEVIHVTYTLSGDTLQRSLSINAEPPRQTMISENIDDDPFYTNCYWDNGMLVFKVTAVVDSASETRTYQVKIRPESTS